MAINKRVSTANALAVLFAILLSLAPNVASAHHPQGFGYSWSCTGGSPTSAGICYVSHTGADARWQFGNAVTTSVGAAIRAGKSDWDLTFSHEFNFIETSGGSYVYWRTANPCGNTSWYGCAVVRYNTTSKRITESSSYIELESDFPWYISTAWGASFPGKYDLWSGAAHEFGHLAGLGHSSEEWATMQHLLPPNSFEGRLLSSHDRLGRCQIYGHSQSYWGGCGTLR